MLRSVISRENLAHEFRVNYAMGNRWENGKARPSPPGLKQIENLLGERKLTMAQMEDIGAIEKRLWTAADTLRANSAYASNENFLPVMGLLFSLHDYSRYLMVKSEIEGCLSNRNCHFRRSERPSSMPSLKGITQTME